MAETTTAESPLPSLEAQFKTPRTRPAGEGAFASLPQGPAILAELSGEWLQPDPAAVATIEQPVLLVGAADSRLELREPNDAMASMLPNARTVLVEAAT